MLSSSKTAYILYLLIQMMARNLIVSDASTQQSGTTAEMICLFPWMTLIHWTLDIQRTLCFAARMEMKGLRMSIFEDVYGLDFIY